MVLVGSRKSRRLVMPGEETHVFMAFTYRGRSVTAKTAVRSKDGYFLFFVDFEGFKWLTGQGIVKVDGNARKIHALQLTVDIQQASFHESEFDPRLGRKYTREEHVGGRWYIHQL